MLKKVIALTAAALMISAVCTSVSANIHNYSLFDEEPAKTETKAAEETDTRPSSECIIDGITFELAEESVTGCTTLMDAQYNAGFDFAVPEKAFKLTEMSYGIVDKKNIQVRYSDPADEDKYVIIRKGKKSPVSDDMTVHEKTYSRTVSSTSVKMYGTPKKVYTAVWTKDGYSYSVRYSSGTTVSSMQSLVSSIITLNKTES
ncbi:MAG: hypothetical protein IJ251_04340 [Oscillospiraceae bacterium]|nr:hypothetical protein [Oscillospiraceae bacterium]